MNRIRKQFKRRLNHADITHSYWGEAFFQRHPDYDALLPEMLAYAEEHLCNHEKKELFVPVYDYDATLFELLQDRGYQKQADYTLWDSVFTVKGEIPASTLPVGYVLQSMVDENDLERRRKAFGLAFNHPEPKDWPSLVSYHGLQQAPDYRPELDVYVVAPDGEFAAFCIVWWDDQNRIASLEPVGTVPAYRRKGLARAAVLEAIRRVVALGVERVFVGSDQEFYKALGFKLTTSAHHWLKRF